jgi:hypothetical protein
LRSPHDAIRAAAADTLSYLGTNVGGREPEILPLLHDLFDRGGGNDLWAYVRAVASVGRNDPASRRRIVDLARPRPPRLSEPGYQGYRHDLTMGERGIAIDAMRYLADYPDECIPVLIDAIDTFEEYDPDECYDGPIGRVSAALERFGPRAGSEAAVALASHLNDNEDDFPKAICLALAAMGSAAVPTLPLLEQFCRNRPGAEWEPCSDESEPDKHSFTGAWAIHQIRKSL